MKKYDPVTSPSNANANLQQKEKHFLQGKTDLEIWRQFKKGNEGAFNYIYQTYFSELFRYGHRFTQDRELIKDAIQDLFIELRKSSTNLADTDSIKFYLYKSLRWKIQLYSKKNAKFLLVQEPSEDWHFDIVFSHEVQLINRQISEERIQHLQKALQTLPKRQKEALYYFYYESMTYEEVAGIMDLDHVKSARNLIYKSLKTLKKEIPLLPMAILLIVFFYDFFVC
ncbi:sigma-70 family RNA polymerase sigma factor [Rapidithrix thailandica]|uniref:Sigma-70 family RNA polymerase sigma factor n=1 Tax=Rapidithrix thailandica TaxID=413964 RepID=A0AAW9RUR1_9BACT